MNINISDVPKSIFVGTQEAMTKPLRQTCMLAHVHTYMVVRGADLYTKYSEWSRQC